MAQRPKDHIRADVVRAAASLFAEMGYEAATMSEIAARAGSSIGNVYRYFPSKEALFAAVVPATFAAEVKRMTRRRIEALGAVRDIQLLARDARYHVLAGELLDHCLAQRERIVILIARAKGTPFASFAEDFAAQLVEWALEHAARAWPVIRSTPQMRFALGEIYANFLRSVANAFTVFHREGEARAAVALLTAHHQSGLRHLFETAATAGTHGGGNDGKSAHVRRRTSRGATARTRSRQHRPRGAGASAALAPPGEAGRSRRT